MGMAVQFGVTVTLSVVECASCSMPFGVPFSFENAYRESHETFCCPRGHNQSWKGSTELERERERRIHAEADRARAEDRTGVAERQRASARGQVTKMKNRIAKGVCPFCNRHFENVQRHMETVHEEGVSTS